VAKVLYCVCYERIALFWLGHIGLQGCKLSASCRYQCAGLCQAIEATCSENNIGTSLG
jgi:hypothetical protein